MPRVCIAVCALLWACTPDTGTAPAGAPTVRLGAHLDGAGPAGASTARSARPTIVAKGDWADFTADPYEPLGPMAVVADGDGFAILDQQGLKLRRYDADGRARPTIAIPSPSTLDAARTADGFALLVYHRVPQPGWWVQQVGLDGRLLSQLDAPDAADTPSALFYAAASTGDVGGLGADGDVYVEQAHGLVYGLTGDVLPGRPAGDHRALSARKLDDRHVDVVWQDATPSVGGNNPSDARHVTLETDRTLSNLVGLDVVGDAAVVTMLLYTEGPPTDDVTSYAMTDAELRVVVVDPAGHVRDELSLEPGDGAWDTNRVVAVDADGRLFQLRVTDAGVEVRRYDLGVQP